MEGLGDFVEFEIVVIWEEEVEVVWNVIFGFVSELGLGVGEWCGYIEMLCEFDFCWDFNLVCFLVLFFLWFFLSGEFWVLRKKGVFKSWEGRFLLVVDIN